MRNAGLKLHIADRVSYTLTEMLESKLPIPGIPLYEYPVSIRFVRSQIHNDRLGQAVLGAHPIPVPEELRKA